MFNTWEFNIVSFLISIVFYYQFYKLAVKETRKDGAAIVLLQLIAAVSTFILIPLFPLRLSNEPIVYAFLLFACVFYALSDRLNITVRKHLAVSTFSIIEELHRVLLLIIGIVFFAAPFVWIKMLGAVIVVFGNLILLYRKGKFRLNKYILLAFVSTLTFAVALSIDIDISRDFNLPFYIFLTLLIPAVFLILGERVTFPQIKGEFKRGRRKYYAVAGVAWSLTLFFSLRSYNLGDIALTVPMQGLSILLNIIFAHIILNERKNYIRKIIAGTIVLLGIYLTVLN